MRQHLEPELEPRRKPLRRSPPELNPPDVGARERLELLARRRIGHEAREFQVGAGLVDRQREIGDARRLEGHRTACGSDGSGHLIRHGAAFGGARKGRGLVTYRDLAALQQQERLQQFQYLGVKTFRLTRSQRKAGRDRDVARGQRAQLRFEPRVGDVP